MIKIILEFNHGGFESMWDKVEECTDVEIVIENDIFDET